MNSSPKSERTRLARELHDGLAQELSAFGFRLDQIIGDNKLDNANRGLLRQLRFSLSGIITQVRNEIYELRSENLKTFQQQLDDQIATLLSGSEIDYQISGVIEVDSDLKFELLRAIREVVLNARQHSGCSKIEITLTDKIITISDDGMGGVSTKANSFGITGVFERLNMIDAKLKIDSKQSGTTIQIEL